MLDAPCPGLGNSGTNGWKSILNVNCNVILGILEWKHYSATLQSNLIIMYILMFIIAKYFVAFTKN